MLRSVYILALCFATMLNATAQTTDSPAQNKAGATDTVISETAKASDTVGTKTVEATDTVGTEGAKGSGIMSTDPDFVHASILFISPDKSHIATYYGHVAMRLQCPSEGMDYAFTFEGNPMVSAVQLIAGLDRLAYMPAPFHQFLDLYDGEGRDVYEYDLNLTLDEKRNLWRLVDQYVKKGPYLQNDYLNTGCAMETASFVRTSIDGRVVYDSFIDNIGDTQHTIIERHTDRGGWFRLFLYIFASTDCDRRLTAEQRLVLPADMEQAWKGASIEGKDSSMRPLLSKLEPTVYKAATHMPQPDNLYPTYWVFGIVLAVVALVCVLQICRRGGTLIGRTVDTVLLCAVSVIAVIMMGTYIVSDIPAASGWNPHFVVYNLVPLLVYIAGRYKDFPPIGWRSIYIVYSVVLAASLVWMILNPQKVDLVPELLIISTLLIRCTTKYIVNKN